MLSLENAKYIVITINTFSLLCQPMLLCIGSWLIYLLSQTAVCCMLFRSHMLCFGSVLSALRLHAFRESVSTCDKFIWPTQTIIFLCLILLNPEWESEASVCKGSRSKSFTSIKGLLGIKQRKELQIISKFIETVACTTQSMTGCIITIQLMTSHQFRTKHRAPLKIGMARLLASHPCTVSYQLSPAHCAPACFCPLQHDDAQNVVTMPMTWAPSQSLWAKLISRTQVAWGIWVVTVCLGVSDTSLTFQVYCSRLAAYLDQVLWRLL